ncbi:MAG: hypothetical protein WBC35_02570, partial [Saprospiraceae bacterium]
MTIENCFFPSFDRTTPTLKGVSRSLRDALLSIAYCLLCPSFDRTTPSLKGVSRSFGTHYCPLPIDHCP